MPGSPGQTRPLMWINMSSSWEKICKLIFFQMPVGIWWHWVNTENIETIRELSRLSGNFPGYLETFCTIWKISSTSGNFPDNPKIFQTVLELPSAISRVTRKNFPDAQKLSGWQCHDAMMVFGPLGTFYYTINAFILRIGYIWAFQLSGNYQLGIWAFWTMGRWVIVETMWTNYMGACFVVWRVGSAYKLPISQIANVLPTTWVTWLFAMQR